MNNDIKYIEGIIPDRENKHGRAWRLNLSAIRKKKNILDGADATIASWVVEAKWAHPMWGNYFLSVIHLRPTTQLPKPKLNDPDATHEIWLYALDPSHVPSLENPMAHRLEPVNYVGQFKAASDIDADSMIEHTVMEIIQGILNPDTDARRHWIARYGSSNINVPTNPNKPKR